MGVYDGYNPPSVVPMEAASAHVPEYSGLASASYWIGRCCLMCYSVLIIASVSSLIIAPENEFVRGLIPIGVAVAMLGCFVAHAVGILLGFVGLFLPSRKKSRAVLGIILNGFVPGCLVVLALNSFLPRL